MPENVVPLGNHSEEVARFSDALEEAKKVMEDARVSQRMADPAFAADVARQTKFVKPGYSDKNLLDLLLKAKTNRGIDPSDIAYHPIGDAHLYAIAEEFLRRHPQRS